MSKKSTITKHIKPIGYCKCVFEYGHKWNEKKTKLICIHCEKYV